MYQFELSLRLHCQIGSKRKTSACEYMKQVITDLSTNIGRIVDFLFLLLFGLYRIRCNGDVLIGGHIVRQHRRFYSAQIVTERNQSVNTQTVPGDLLQTSK